MTEKRFEVGNLKIQDTAPKGRVYLLDMQGGVNALCNLINGLNDKSNRLEKENEQLKSKNKILLEHCDDLQERNDRQAKQLDNIYNLIEKQDWETLTGLIQEFQECEEQLKIEMECYE